MHRKPFRTPFLKVRQRDSDEENKSSSANSAATGSPPRKKLKEKDEPSEQTVQGTVSKRAVGFTSLAHSSIRPLLRLNNAAPKVNESVPEACLEIYFTVLWRKYTTKKYGTRQIFDYGLC